MAVYLASPMASTGNSDNYSVSKSKIERNLSIAKELREAGFDIFLPQDNQKRNGKETLKQQLKVIKNCEFLILILSDTRGAYLEAGYAKALGKKIYAIEVEETRKYSDWLESFFDYIAKDVQDLIKHLKNQEEKVLEK
jgi:nucleoside 2-deoxyribosyltransferase